MLSVGGEIDLLTAPVLREALRPILEGEAGGVVVDLSEVTFMDSSGVHLLVETFQRLGSQNRRMAITCREHGQVHRLLALMGLLDTVTVRCPDDSARSATGANFAPTQPDVDFAAAWQTSGRPAARRRELRRHYSADPASPTIALAMARTREPARPSLPVPDTCLTEHDRGQAGGR